MIPTRSVLMSRLGGLTPWAGPILLLLIVTIALSGCGIGGGAGASATATPTPTPSPPLTPASPGADPISLLAWLFTPLFQTLFIVLVAMNFLTGNIAIAIVVLTLLIKLVTIPLFRSQTVSQRRMQLIQPEMREIQRRFKGDRARISQAQMELYKERGINPAAGCLPIVLQMILLIPMYAVIRDGLTNPDPTAMVTLFGFRLPILECQNVVNGVVDATKSCLNPVAFGVNWGQPDVFLSFTKEIGLSTLAIASALLQFIQGRMMMPQTPSDGQVDQNAAVQRQTMFLFPVITLFYGALVPAGLFIYWMVTTLFAIAQQYLIVGFGSLFPIFGWMPGFAVGHTPRFPVAIPAHEDGGPKTSVAGRRSQTGADRAASAAATVRPATKGRGRRGRRH